MDPHQNRPSGSQPPSFIRTPGSDQTGSSAVSVPSASSSTNPRSTATTAPPSRRGRSAAATRPTCLRRTVPSAVSERTSPAAMSTQRSPPHRSDQTGPSAWCATGSVTCSARTAASAGAGRTVAAVLLPLELLLLGLGLHEVRLAGDLGRGVAVGLAVDLLGAAEQLLGLRLHLLEEAHARILPQVIPRQTAAARPPRRRVTAATPGRGWRFRPRGTSTRSAPAPADHRARPR